MRTDMNQKTGTDPAALPSLGRKLLWLDNVKNVDRIVYVLVAVCAALFAADFLYQKYVKLSVESIPGFYALYGFFMPVVLVICVRFTRRFLKRPEDYYAPKDVESEAYPEDQLGRETNND